MQSRYFLPLGFVLFAIVAGPLSPSAADPDDETAVEALLQSWLDASNKQDVDAIAALFSSDAKVDSLVANAKVSKEIYLGAMKQAQAQATLGRNFEGKVTSLTFPTPERAVVEWDTNWETKGQRTGYRARSHKQRWTLTKREGRWLILETEYLK